MVVTELWGLMGKSWNNRTAMDSTEEEADGGAEESTGCLESPGIGKGKILLIRDKKIRT